MASKSFNSPAGKNVVVDCTGKDIAELFVIGGGKKGPLVCALEDGAAIVIKNLDKAKTTTIDGGTVVPANVVMLTSTVQFITGETDELKIWEPTAAVGSEPLASYKRSDIKSGFSLSVELADPRKLPDSLRRRLEESRMLVIAAKQTASPSAKARPAQ